MKTTLTRRIKMNLTTKALLACIAVLALLGSSAFAAIIVEQEYFYGEADDVISGTTTTWSAASLGFTSQTVDKLVVGFTQRVNQPFSITYNGVAMTEVTQATATTNNDGTAGIFYLDNVTLGGDIVVTSATASFGRPNISAYALTGTAAGTAASFDTGLEPNSALVSISETTGADGGFVLGVIGLNGFITATATVTDRIDYYASHPGVHAAWLGTSSQTYTLTHSGNGASGVIAYFAPDIPEPCSLALLALGGMLIGRRTRK